MEMPKIYVNPPRSEWPALTARCTRQEEEIGERVAAILAEGLKRAGIELLTAHFFDTLQLRLGARAQSVYQAALAAGYNLRHVDGHALGVSIDEKTTRDDIAALLAAFGASTDSAALDEAVAAANATMANADVWPEPPRRPGRWNSRHSANVLIGRLLRELPGAARLRVVQRSRAAPSQPADAEPRQRGQGRRRPSG